MTERLLQFIWQFQYFNKNDLTTIVGDPVEIIFPGSFNKNQGPDFLDGRIKIGNTILAGNIELHLCEDDWNRHAHTPDPNYRNIILHVLWEHPEELKLTLPTVSLKDKVSKILLERYQSLMRSRDFVACRENARNATALVWLKWKERLLAERLLRKSAMIENYLLQSNHNWEEVFWWMLARNFGIPINAEAFEAIARSLPLIILARHKSHIHQLEAMLLGQAGLLNNEFDEQYADMLSKEYGFLKNKYGFSAVEHQVHFLRMRPGNFPSVRLAQLAMLLHRSIFLFSRVKESQTVREIYELLSVKASDYWDTHYRLEEPGVLKKKTVGPQMIENIIINTIVPTIFAYGQLRNENSYKTRALEWLEQLAPEKNSITNQWTEAGIENLNAWDSQSLIELKKEYCDHKRCLECSIGNSLLREKSAFELLTH
ncbi:MAG TPA: DUF2851 family protein [Chitinophagaceae bacterium]